MIPKKLAINNYIYFRYKEEWVECRVKETILSTKKNVQSAILYIPKYNIILPDPIPDDMIHMSCIENMKKFKISYKNIDLPPFFINFLHEDRLKLKNNFLVKLPSNYSVKKIISDFSEFINKNKLIYEDELDEMIAGFNYCFDKTIYNFLLYDKEIQQYDNVIIKNKTNASEIYGIEHFIRMLYYCKGSVECEVFLEYMFYLCDFLDMNYKKYFIEREYEELL